MPILRSEVTKKINLNSEKQIGKQASKQYREANDEQKSIIKEQVGSFIVREINRFLDQSKSPVKGGRYKRVKDNGQPSLLLDTGDMRSFLNHESEGNNVITGLLEGTPDKQLDKAFGHNTGFRGHPHLGKKHQREFIPNTKKEYRDEILTGIRRIIREVTGGSES